MTDPTRATDWPEIRCTWCGETRLLTPSGNRIDFGPPQIEYGIYYCDVCARVFQAVLRIEVGTVNR